jgi:SOS regulatory protein LexA
MENPYNRCVGKVSEFLKEKRKEYLESIEGKGKTDADIARAVGVKPSTWSNWIWAGYDPRTENLARLAEFFGPGVYQAAGIDRSDLSVGLNIPLLGRIAAGTAIPMPKLDFPPYGSEETIPIMRNWLPPRADTSNVFALEVEGDSMIEEGIKDGDIIFLSKTNVAENGDLVAVRIDEDDSVTLKKFYRQNGTVILQPANSKMQPTQVNANLVHIEGKIVFSIHKWW